MIRGGKRITPIRFCGPSSPKLYHFKNIKMDNMSTRHAEIGAINCSKPKQREMKSLRRTSLIVVRFLRKNTEENSFELSLSNSKPCKQCIKILKSLRLKSIIYVDKDGNLVNEKPSHIHNCVDSKGTYSDH